MNKLALQDSDPITKEEGLKIGVRVAKNRCVYDNPYKKCEFYVIYGVGVDKMYEVITNAPDAGVLRVKGSWFYYDDEHGNIAVVPEATVDGVKVKDHIMRFQGKTKLRTFLSENEWFLEQLKTELANAIKQGKLTAQFLDTEEVEQLKKVDSEIEKEMETLKKEEHKERSAPKRKKTTPPKE